MNQDIFTNKLYIFYYTYSKSEIYTSQEYPRTESPTKFRNVSKFFIFYTKTISRRSGIHNFKGGTPFNGTS